MTGYVLLENGLQRYYQFKVSITKKRLDCDNFIVIHNICFSLKYYFIRLAGFKQLNIANVFNSRAEQVFWTN